MRFILIKILVVLSVSFSTFGCQEPFGIESLENGLSNYSLVRNVDQSFVPDLEITKVAFFHSDNDSLGIVLKLNNLNELSVVENYSLGMYLYQDGRYFYNEEVQWNTHPKIQKFNDHKYFIENIAVPHTQIDTLVFYLFDRDKYRKIIGNRIVLKNISI